MVYIIRVHAKSLYSTSCLTTGAIHGICNELWPEHKMLKFQISDILSKCRVQTSDPEFWQQHQWCVAHSDASCCNGLSKAGQSLVVLQLHWESVVSRAYSDRCSRHYWHVRRHGGTRGEPVVAWTWKQSVASSQSYDIQIFQLFALRCSLPNFSRYVIIKLQ